MTDNLKSLAEAISQLNAMQDTDNDQRAVELYRAIFRNDGKRPNLGPSRIWLR